MYNFKSQLESLTNDLFKQISPLGSYQFFLIMTAIFFLTQNYTEFIFLILGFFIISSVVISIRLNYFRERPDKTKFKSELGKIRASSFPSLHAARITFLMLALSSFFKNKLTTAFLIILALLVLYSRIHKKRHYPIDISVGAIFGIIIYLILQYFL